MKANTFAVATAVAALTLGAGCTPPTPTWYFDSDMDGYGDPSIVITADEQPDQYVANRRDCNDTDAAIKPGATEVFDDIDNNCDGVVDNVAHWYADVDTDGFGDSTASLQQPLQPDGYVEDNTDCDDTDAAINPGATEVFDGIDNNCDGLIDDLPSWYADTDVDGFGDPTVSVLNHLKPDGYVSDNTDCDDTNPNINPWAAEVDIDGIDNNCNGLIDEFEPGDNGPAGGIIFYVDETGQHGLEVTPVNLASGNEWGCSGVNVPGADGTAIGTGAQNTLDILAACSASEGNVLIAERADAYSLNGFDDWFLPSKGELDLLYQHRYLVGMDYITSILPYYYVSSSEVAVWNDQPTNSYVHLVNFSHASIHPHWAVGSKSSVQGFRVRYARAF